ncbi:MAG: hypothetical protein ABIJ37_06675 [Pseudomonadota bacterium]
MVERKLDFSKGRHRPADYINICKSIADSYPIGIPHGLQKDGIQNAFHTASKSTLLEVTFELIENKKGIFFTIIDSNTKGLMGKVLETDEYNTIRESDHWARFEGLGFTTPNLDAIGARGQGKFIFLAASEDFLMYYDSFREDGTYRLGATSARKTDCPMLHWDEDQGCSQLKELTSLEPLSKVGTRIIIVNPIKELRDEIENGNFMAAIEETWFRAIEKGRVRIRVKTSDYDKVAKIPKLFPIPSKDTDKIKVWIRNNGEIKLLNGERFKIKHLQIAYKKGGKIPEQFRGVAIIHNNMKITSINMEGVPLDITDNIYGFIEFDRDLDRELRKNYNQNPNHYDLTWRRAVPKAIKEYIRKELREFGYKKLGIGTDPRERRKQIRSSAEIDALRYLSKYAKDLDLFGRKGGPVKPPPPRPDPPPPPPNKKIGIMLHSFNFPDSERAPRVNWGEEIKDFEVRIFNKTNEHLKGRLRIFMLFGGREINILHDEKSIDITPYLKPKPLGPFSITFSKSVFPYPGEYRLKIRLINEVSNLEIDSLSKILWIEKDPKFRLPFETLPDDFTDKEDSIAKRQWITEGILGQTPILYYNIGHSSYKEAENNERLTDYLFEIFLEGSMDFILNRPIGEDGTPDYHPLNSERILKDPKEAYLEISGKIAEIKSKYYEEI